MSKMYLRPEEMLSLGEELVDVWNEGVGNHAEYSTMENDEADIQFLALGMAGEVGEVANFVKKRWRDGEPHDEDIRLEIADVVAYALMLASKMGMTPRTLVAEVAHKQKVFRDKMIALEKARAA